MKILFNCSEPLALGIRRRLFEEGNDVFDDVGRSGEAEITLTDDLTNCSNSSIGIFIPLPQLVRENIVQQSKSNVPYTLEKFCVSKFWTGENYLAQNLISFPVFGQFNDNLGKQDCVGVAARYLSKVDYAEFEQETLVDFLQRIKHKGFVSFVFERGELSDLHLGIPFLGMYNALVGVPAKEVTPWLVEPSRLLESWTVSLLVATESFGEGIRVQFGHTKMTQAWWLTESQRMDSFVPKQSQVVVLTGWAYRLKDSWQQVLEAARLLNVKNKLYRTDVASQVERRVEELRVVRS